MISATSMHEITLDSRTSETASYRAKNKNKMPCSIKLKLLQKSYRELAEPLANRCSQKCILQNTLLLEKNLQPLLQYFPPKDVTLRNVCFVYGYNRFTEMPIRSPTLYNGLKDGYSNFFWIALMCRTRLAFEMIYSTNSFLSLNRAMCERRDFVRDLFERCAR